MFSQLTEQTNQKVLHMYSLYIHTYVSTYGNALLNYFDVPTPICGLDRDIHICSAPNNSMKLILLCVWAKQTVLGSAKTA